MTSVEPAGQGGTTPVAPAGSRTLLRFDEQGLVLRQCGNGTSATRGRASARPPYASRPTLTHNKVFQTIES